MHPLVQRDYGGEDAYFTSPVGGGAFGVADGVGGWQDSGINPAGIPSSPNLLARGGHFEQGVASGFDQFGNQSCPRSPCSSDFLARYICGNVPGKLQPCFAKRFTRSADPARTGHAE